MAASPREPDAQPSTDGPPAPLPAPSAMETTYRGNCHCAAFVYEVWLPPIHSALECRCAMCHRKGYLWNLVGGGRRHVEVVTGTWEDLARFVPNALPRSRPRSWDVRALQGIDTWTITKVPYACPAADAPAAPAVHAGPLPAAAPGDGGHKLHTGSCHCGAVTVALASKPLDATYADRTVDCNCSVCVRNGYVWAYPRKEHVVLGSGAAPCSSSSSSSTTTTTTTTTTGGGGGGIGRYHFSHHVLNKTFCAACGVCLTNEWADRGEEELRALGAPVPTPAWVAELMAPLHPVNLRVFPGVNLAGMKPPFRIKGATEVPPAYVNP
ncbi:hypothetical protein VTJ83DRAFT_5023 [Remersonia thermophila]|uniref:CENP-V/GFA domain-containing protein n=1 Tax=Remersonia thermophila TaxID=72144 RepID=A0ABR4DBM3_9PEZI